MIRRRWTSLFSFLTILFDACIILVTLYLGYRANFPEPALETFLRSQWKLAVFSAVVYTFLGMLFGAYRRCYFSPFVHQCLAMGKAYLLGTLVIFATLFLFKNTYYSQGALLTYVILFPVVFFAGRGFWLMMRMALRSRQVGVGQVVMIKLRNIRREAEFEPAEFTIADTIKEGFIDDESLRASRSSGRDLVVCGESLHEAMEAIGRLRLTDEENMAVRVVAPDVHSVLARVRLYDRSGVLVRGGGFEPPGFFYAVTKRMVDVLLGACLLIASVPLLVLVAIAVWLESRSPVLFKQTRALSPLSKRFEVLKFRSMRNGGNNGDGNGEFAQGSHVKHPEDPRVTRVGKIIRKTSLDELPQLLHVLGGSMSLVGPRPLPLADFQRISASHSVEHLWQLRSLAKPGMTGLWQTSGRSDLSAAEMLLLDLYYIEHRSLLFDLELIRQTVPSALFGHGAY